MFASYINHHKSLVFANESPIFAGAIPVAIRLHGQESLWKLMHLGKFWNGMEWDVAMGAA